MPSPSGTVRSWMVAAVEPITTSKVRIWRSRSTSMCALHSFESRGIVVVDTIQITLEMPKKLVAYTY
ncbi:MAG: hypothetical protein ACR2GS_06995 [Thermomicrobiales bacterium]